MSAFSIQRFVDKEWGGHQVEFARINSLDEQITYIENELRISESKEYPDAETRLAYKKHLIDLLDFLHRKKEAAQQLPDSSKPALGDDTPASSEQEEKIDFNCSVAQFVFLWGLLYALDNGLSRHQNQRRWALVAKHFTIKGKELKPSNLAATARNLGLNKTGKPKVYEAYEAVTNFARIMPEKERDIIMWQSKGK